ncbi:MAG: AIR synthase related protein, partial [Dokdonella sp.]
MAEFALIDRIVERAPKSRSDVLVGIGDDAAVLALPPGHQLVVSTDTLIDGVHFPRGTRPADIGWKSLAVNLSDLAAMGASPAWVSLALTLPEPDADFVDDFMDGFSALAAQHRVALIGGDTTRGTLSITVTVHGFVPDGKALLRDGARAGD